MITPLALLVGMSIFLLILGIILVVLSYKVRSTIKLRYEFISIISHKFRTPLTSVRWLTENLAQSETDNFRKKDIQDLHVLNQQLIDLTNTLVELADTEKSQKEQYNFETLPVKDVVNQCFQGIKEAAGVKNIFLSIKFTDEDMKINVDKDRFEFIMHTILENSIVYTKPGGKVDIIVSPYSNKVLINVTDNGIGIPVPEIKHIFSEFFRAPNAMSFDTEGLGVDLFLAQRIAHRLNGEIRVTSEGEDLGSVFEIILPRVK